MASDILDSVKVVDVPSLQKCFATHPYTSNVDHDGTANESYVDDDKIQSRCTDKAVELAKQKRDQTSFLMSIAEEVRKNRSPEESLKVFKIAIENDKSLHSCDDSKFFKALKTGLSHPKNFPNKVASYFSLSSQIIKTCQKNSQFVQDLKEEVESGDEYLKSNLCTILKEMKIQNSCK
jgi:flavodoxin